MQYAERAGIIKEKLDSTDRIILVQVKVERAKKHLRDLAAEIIALQDTTILTPDPNTGVAPHPINLWHPHKFQKVPTLPFDAVTIAGDVVHNIRAALDHLARQLVLVGMDCAPVVPLTEKELRGIEFPIAETFEKYESDKARKTKRMLPEASEAIDKLKPYKGGNDALWRIHELDNIDKHRTLFTLAHDFLFTGDWFDGAYLLKAENPLFAGVEAQVEKDIQLEITEAVSQPNISQANTLLPSLHQLVNFVENLVVSFKPLLRNVYFQFMLRHLFSLSCFLGYSVLPVHRSASSNSKLTSSSFMSTLGAIRSHISNSSYSPGYFCLSQSIAATGSLCHHSM